MAEEDTASVEKNISEVFVVKPSVMQQQQEVKQQLSADTYYKYEDLTSRPFVTLGSEIPENLLHLSHSFGYDSRRRENLQLLDDRTLMFIAGNLLVLLDVVTAEHKYLRSCSGGGIGAITVHPSREFFVAAEKGKQPNILVYEYPSLRLYRVLRGGTAQAFSSVQFNHDGSVLASVGGAPDYMLTLWNWRREEVVLRCKAISQEVYRVSFSPYNPGLLTSSGSGHIKFWKIASTFTGLKLQGHVGHFGITPATDIDGYVELPDGKVVSGTEWGNLLLWDGNAIKAEICRRDGRSCHTGAVQPFVLDDGQLMTIGSDGVVRAWDFESINVADGNGDSGRFEVEPMNEMVVGRNVSLSSVVKSPQTDAFIWFAQDSNGAIWKLDLSFTNTTPDPECLFSFHAGAIKGLDVSQKSHLMATTTPDRSVRVFDFLSKTEVTTSRFNQGGTALIWAPPLVKESGGLLVTGFEDGVVRVLELYSAQRHHMLSGRNPRGDARLRLLQAFKPHTAAVTALAFDRQGDILASGSSDCTVFFFAVGETYSPIGFVHVPGPVQELQWSPRSHVRLVANSLFHDKYHSEIDCHRCCCHSYAEKPDEDYEDPQAARAIRDARENVGDLPLRTETERTVPEHLRTNTERKRAEINVLEKNIRDKQTEMNGRIVALRDTKVRLVSRLQAQAEQLHDVQQRLAVHLRRPPPVLPMVRPEETPERRLQFDSSTLERYRVLREQSRLNFIQQEEEEEEEGTTRLLEQLEKERDVQDRGGGGGGGNLHPSLSSGKIEEDEEEEEEEELNELEAELHREEEIKLLYEQDSLLEQVSELDHTTTQHIISAVL